jgi:capsular polysaccharide biosynthesis protein
MPTTSSLVSLTSERGLMRVPENQRLVIWLDQAEKWYLPPAASVYGERDHNATNVYYALKGGREVEGKGTYLAIFFDVLVSPKGLVFTNDEKLLYESVFPWQIDNFMGQFSSDITEVDGALRPNIQGDVIDLPSAFHCREGGETGYFHFINSILPRVAVRRRLEVAQPDMPMLASTHAGFTKQMFELLGEKNFAGPGKWYRIRQLYYPSPFIIEGDHFTRTRFSSKLLKEMLGPIIEAQKPRKAERRLYLSRGDVSVRRILNEAEVVKLFEQQGFETVTVGGMSVADQIALFSSASHLVSAHGAGLSNVIFMDETATVTEILSPNRLWPTFRTLAARHGQEYHAIIGRDVATDQTAEKGVGNEDFTCDLQAVKFHLQQLRL